MTDAPQEIVLIEDEQGIVALGHPSVVEPWLRSNGLESRDFSAKAADLAAVASKGLQLGSEVMANSGRWVKLTKESAEIATRTGNTLSGGVIRNGAGQIVKHVKFEDLARTAVANPGVLAGVGGVMAQVALEQSLAEITDYLETIDQKVDDLLRDQKDQSVAALVGIGDVIDEAKRVRDQTGAVSATTWSKVSHCGADLAYVRGYCLTKLDGLATGLERADDAKDIERAAQKARTDAQDWLTILARTIQLQDALWVVELERVMADDPMSLQAHKEGLLASRRANLVRIEQTLSALSHRMVTAASAAAEEKVLHPFAVQRAVDSLGVTAGQVASFAEHAGIEADAGTIDGAPTWKRAVGELAAETSEDVQEFGQRALDGALDLGTSAASGARDLGAAAVAGAKDVGTQAQERMRDLAGRLPDVPSLPKFRLGRKDRD